MMAEILCPWINIHNGVTTIKKCPDALLDWFLYLTTTPHASFSSRSHLRQGNLRRMEKDNDLGPCLFVANHASWCK